jgi:hypothetical protein
MKRNFWVSALVGTAMLVAVPTLLVPHTVEAQVTRESGVSSLAGVLTSDDTSDQYKFTAKAGDILHADIDSDVYEMVGREDHHELAVVPGPDDGHDDGCGGPGGLVLEVVDAAGDVVCWADRPNRPGWQRDAAVHCPLVDSGTYWLRIGLSEHDPHEHAAELTSSESLGEGLVPYIMNVSLRAEAPEGLLARAISASRNNLP